MLMCEYAAGNLWNDAFGVLSSDVLGDLMNAYFCSSSLSPLVCKKHSGRCIRALPFLVLLSKSSLAVDFSLYKSSSQKHIDGEIV